MKTLLIVEDAPDVTVILKSVLGGRWQVSVAADFAEAVRLIVDHKYDLIVTDFNFPGGDGNLIAKLVREPANRVVLHTSNLTDARIKRELFDMCYDKLDRELIKELKGAA